MIHNFMNSMLSIICGFVLFDFLLLIVNLSINEDALNFHGEYSEIFTA